MKIRILFFVFILSQLSSFSQQWCAPGSVWNYKLDDHQIGGTRFGFIELKLSGTDSLNGKLCHVISGYYKGIMYNKYVPSIPTTTQTWNYKFYTYQDSGVIYISQGARFDTLVDFNAVPGDKWLSTFGSTACVNGWNAWTVIDTGHVTINGLYLRTVKAGYNLFIEGIGGVQGFLYDREGCVYDGGAEGVFTCFKSDNFLLYMSPKHSECANMVSLTELTSTNNLKVFPNPGTGIFNIELPRQSVIQVFDIWGRLILESSFNSGMNILDLENLLTGIYYLQVFDGLQLQVSKLIKE